jgi:hypothetical protein
MIISVLKSFGRIPAPNMQAFAHPLRRHTATESNPYSPALCISLLLIVGLFLKIGPAIHANLVQIVQN